MKINIIVPEISGRKLKNILFFSFVFILWACTSNSLDPTGSYKLVSENIISDGNTYGRFGDIYVTKLGADKIVLELSVCRGAPSYNMGLVDDTLVMKNNHSVLKCDMPEIDQKGELHFYFTKKGIRVKERNIQSDGFCSFGHAVHADGFYKIRSRKIPKNMIQH